MQRSQCKNIPPFVSVLIATVFVIYLAGCGPCMKTYKLYQGPQRASNETAQLVCKGETIQLNPVNGQKSPKGKDTFGNVTLEILPGEFRTDDDHAELEGQKHHLVNDVGVVVLGRDPILMSRLGGEDARRAEDEHDQANDHGDSEEATHECPLSSVSGSYETESSGLS